MVTLSKVEARRLALHSLGLTLKRPLRAGLQHVRATAARLGAIQIDSVNVLARAHYLPTFSRYGPYRANALDQLAYEKRELFEYWGHAACFLPLEMYPLMRWRMDRQRRAWKLSPARAAFMEAVYQEVAERGPIAAGSISIAGKSTGPWWGWSPGKLAVEILLAQGRLAIAGRRQFARLYDIAERVMPRRVLDAPPIPERDAKKELFLRAAGAMGVGTSRDIAQYFHVDAWWDRRSMNGTLPPQSSTQELFDALVSEGRLQPVQIEGWKRPAYMIPDAPIPKTADTRALVSPFDPVLWERKWTKSVFNFDYQIEIYVPAAKRIYGYYVLPFLLGDRFAGRVDLKADRRSSTLIVRSAHLEPGRNARSVAQGLAGELTSLAAWLSLGRFRLGEQGDPIGSVSADALRTMFRAAGRMLGP